MRSRVLVLAVAVLGLAGCGGDGGTGGSATTDRNEAMLANLPSCDRVPMDEGTEVTAEVAGLVLPEGARVTSTAAQGALTTVEATIRLTPLDVRAHYQERTDIELLSVEDEVFESEVLLRAQDRRMYLRATALCADGTALTAVVGPDSDDAGLPGFRSGGGG
ncbi:hypothetical protein [Plantactinospora sp. KLBMP9567]|uniref:hypothetical protein n=1 Tax=Plantactinospora sp. KLBMP9567 TaxID=3085900 RepID=UPI002981B466|nr:hypothetical protein [Plantactinospora sp. KLBMP9567]MDW5326616.1 hypothetical protein [Plantactinospora sp. KLBMP9567]